MVTAYLLMNTKPGAEVMIAEKLVSRKEVKDITIVYGIYDLIIKLQVKNMNLLQEFILNLRKDKNIEQTATLISTASA